MISLGRNHGCDLGFLKKPPAFGDELLAVYCTVAQHRKGIVSV